MSISVYALLRGLPRMAACLLAASLASADEVTRDMLVAWIAQPGPAVLPDAGTVLTSADRESIAALLPPGYSAEFDFEGAELEIQARATHFPHSSYQAATARFAGQARLDGEGALVDYTAGQPFSDAQIAAAAPEQGGYMVAWNRIYRWQNYGWRTDALMMAYLRPTADGKPGQLVDGLEGGGTVDRYLTQSYHRVYLSHLAMHPDTDYRVNVSDSDTRLYKDYVEFFEPFDVKGTKFVIERSLDAHEEDQVNSYLPTQRRVRRLSAQERADSFMGSDLTFDDFEGFSGRVLDYKWTYLGRKDVLGVADSKDPLARFFGPNSRVPHDRWQVRPCHMVEIQPVWDQHPYASKYIFFDAESYNLVAAVVINRENQVWKFFNVVYHMPTVTTSDALETSAPVWVSTVGIDRIRNTATVARALEPTTLPIMSERQIERRFNVSNLTEGR